MLLEGQLAEFMVLVEPKLYREYVSYSPSGVPMLYVRMQKALYSMLESALAFYKLLRKKLEDEGFVVNPYGPCVANKEVSGSHMTVTWHVDDLKVSHVKEAEVEKFGDFLKATFVKNDLKMTHYCGDIHNYLGIGLDYSEKGKFKVSMIP